MAVPSNSILAKNYALCLGGHQPTKGLYELQSLPEVEGGLSGSLKRSLGMAELFSDKRPSPRPSLLGKPDVVSVKSFGDVVVVRMSVREDLPPERGSQ